MVDGSEQDNVGQDANSSSSNQAFVPELAQGNANDEPDAGLKSDQNGIAVEGNRVAGADRGEDKGAVEDKSTEEAAEEHQPEVQGTVRTSHRAAENPSNR